MSTGERFRSGGARGISRFLAEHQDCDGGVDVQRAPEVGGGRLKMTCLGCGQSMNYKTGVPVELSLPGAAPGPRNGAAMPEGPAAAAVEPDPRPARPRRRESRRAPEPKTAWKPPRWLPVGVIGVVVTAGIVMIGTGLLRSDDDGASEPQAIEDQAAEVEPLDQPAQAATAREAPPAVPGPQASDVRLDRQVVEERFVIGLPAGWTQSGDPYDGFTFVPRDATAGVTVFFEPGTQELEDLAALATDYLEQRHPRARLSKPRPTHAASEPALKVRASYPGGTETALVLTSGGFSFLQLKRVERSSSERRRAEARAVADSFDPL